MKEIPEGWVIVKITDTSLDKHPPVYKVFASWRGGYLDSNSWKMNSGIKSVEETDTHYIFYGYSGSEYHCDKRYYGNSTGYAGMILQDIIDRAYTKGYLIEELPHNYNFKDIENESK
jgi:hypothetical protein